MASFASGKVDFLASAMQYNIIKFTKTKNPAKKWLGFVQ
jgi:hypothetical protein